MLADMLAYHTGLMNPVSRLLWRVYEINGNPSRYRGEAQRQQLAVHPLTDRPRRGQRPPALRM